MSNLNNPVAQQSVTELGNLFLSVTGGGVFYVGSAATVAGLGQVGQGIAQRSFTTVDAALAQAVSGRGDIIYLLPGYTESITGADAWPSLGTKTDISIIGMGHTTNRPTITWTAAGSTVLMDSANFSINNCVLQLEPTTGTVNVAAPITVSANGCSITNCRINCGTDANNKVTIGVTTASASDFVFSGNVVRGAALATCTTFLRIVGGANVVITDNDIACGTTSAAVGPIQNLTTVSTTCDISRNKVQNSAASSTACITWALASSTGWIADNKCRNMTDANLAWIVVTSGDMQLDNNKGVNNSNETAILIGTPSA